MKAIELDKLEMLIFQRLKTISADRDLKRQGIELAFLPDSPNNIYDRVKDNCVITMVIPSFSASTEDNLTTSIIIDLTISIINESRKIIYKLIDKIINEMLSNRKFEVRLEASDEDDSDFCFDYTIYDKIELDTYRLFPAEGKLWRAELNFTIQRQI